MNNFESADGDSRQPDLESAEKQEKSAERQWTEYKESLPNAYYSYIVRALKLELDQEIINQYALEIIEQLKSDKKFDQARQLVKTFENLGLNFLDPSEIKKIEVAACHELMTMPSEYKKALDLIEQIYGNTSKEYFEIKAKVEKQIININMTTTITDLFQAIEERAADGGLSFKHFFIELNGAGGSFDEAFAELQYLKENLSEASTVNVLEFFDYFGIPSDKISNYFRLRIVNP